MARTSFLVIVTDQQRERAFWPSGVTMPAFESLRARGLSFSRAYTPSALCTPARAALFTGQHASAVGMDDNVNFPWQGSLSRAVPTLGTRMASLGYRVGYVGKWHLTKTAHLDAAGLRPYGFADWRPPDTHGVPHGGLRDDPGIADRAAAWLGDRARDDAPFCLVASFVNPHDIMFSPRVGRPTRLAHRAPSPPHLDETLDAKPSVQKRFRVVENVVAGRVGRPLAPPWQHFFDAYVDYHLAVDRCVARVLAALDAGGLRARTTVVYTSDHGELAGAHGLRGKGPVVYEENSRVPLVWCPSEGVRAGATTEALHASIDLVPTLLAQAGATPDALRDLPGVDQGAVLADPAARPRDAVLFVYRARSTMGVPWSRARGWLMGRFDGRYKFARYHAQGEDPVGANARVERCEHELYDLARDPFEVRNLAGELTAAELARHGEALDELARRERAWPPNQVADARATTASRLAGAVL